MPNYKLDLLDPNIAYMYGFIQTDGSLNKNKKVSLSIKGRLTVHISAKDAEILEHFKSIIPFESKIRYFVKDTNFKKCFESVIWTVYHNNFRKALVELGLPYGRKHKLITIPAVPFSAVDYFRGVIDGDGSIGCTRTGLPFVSLCTSSIMLAEGYIRFIESITGKTKTTSPNKRDGAYNIMITREDAQLVAEKLYYDDCVGLQRKKDKAVLVSNWGRPADMRKRDYPIRFWEPNEDAVLLKYSPDEAAKILNRTLKSVSVRKWRLVKRGLASAETIPTP